MSTLYKAVTSNWEISEKVVGMVVDNAANMCSAVRLTGFVMFNCTAHTLQLAIHDALDDNEQMQLVLAKCRAIVGHFKRSNIDKARLVNEQKKLEMVIHKLIQEVS